MLYWWAKDLPLTKTAEEVDVIAGTASNGLVCFASSARHTFLTTPSQSAFLVIPSIDERKLDTRKYNRGPFRDGMWVFGGIDRATKEVFLVQVPDRPLCNRSVRVLELHGKAVKTRPAATEEEIGELWSLMQGIGREVERNATTPSA